MRYVRVTQNFERLIMHEQNGDLKGSSDVLSTHGIGRHSTTLKSALK